MSGVRAPWIGVNGLIGSNLHNSVNSPFLMLRSYITHKITHYIVHVTSQSDVKSDVTCQIYDASMA